MQVAEMRCACSDTRVGSPEGTGLGLITSGEPWGSSY